MLESKIKSICEQFHEYAVYTMRHYNELIKIYAGNKSGEFVENKLWVTGENEFQKAKRNGQPMLLLFSAAEEERGVIFAAQIQNITLDRENRTTLSVL